MLITALLLLALSCFVLATFNVNTPLNLIGLGLAIWCFARTLPNLLD